MAVPQRGIGRQELFLHWHSLKFGMNILLPFYLLIVSILIAITVYDLKHKIIPDGMVFSFDIIAFIFLF